MREEGRQSEGRKPRNDEFGGSESGYVRAVVFERTLTIEEKGGRGGM